MTQQKVYEILEDTHANIHGTTLRVYLRMRMCAKAWQLCRFIAFCEKLLDLS